VRGNEGGKNKTKKQKTKPHQIFQYKKTLLNKEKHFNVLDKNSIAMIVADH